MPKEAIFKKGQIVIVTKGAYSDYTIFAVGRAKCDFTETQVLDITWHDCVPRVIGDAVVTAGDPYRTGTKLRPCWKDFVEEIEFNELWAGY